MLLIQSMEDKILYQMRAQIIEYNVIALEILKIKKADKSKVLSLKKIDEALEECKQVEGDIYDKAVVLLTGLIKKHPFASGNRRTAFIAIKDFLLMNKAKFGIKDDPNNAKIMLGIRENFYSKKELKEWIHHGKIREFKR